MGTFYFKLKIKYMSTNQMNEKLVSVFNQDELAALMTAMAGYINVKRKQGRSTGIESVVFNKVTDALLLSNYMNATVIDRGNGKMGVAEYKMSEAQLDAMYESDVRAHS
jgi:hypothetical protein